MIILGGIKFFWIELFCESELIEQLLLFPLVAILSIALLPFAALEFMFLDLLLFLLLSPSGAWFDIWDMYWGE